MTTASSLRPIRAWLLISTSRPARAELAVFEGRHRDLSHHLYHNSFNQQLLIMAVAFPARTFHQSRRSMSLEIQEDILSEMDLEDRGPGEAQ